MSVYGETIITVPLYKVHFVLIERRQHAVMLCKGVLRQTAAETNQTSSSSNHSSHQHLILDSHPASVAIQALQCLCHVFSWVSLETAVTHAPASLLTKLFDYVTFVSGGEAVLSELAMCCVNELMSKNHVPSQTCLQFILAVFHHTLTLLQSVINTSQPHVIIARFEQLTPRSQLSSYLYYRW